MKFRERSNSGEEKKRDPEPPAAHGSPQELWKIGDDLLAAGDEAIRRALSGNSRAFLAANRQEGGE